MHQAGAERIYHSRPFAAHPGGSVAIGSHLDVNLATRIPGLYVCDASVLPEPWGLPRLPLSVWENVWLVISVGDLILKNLRHILPL